MAAGQYNAAAEIYEQIGRDALVRDGRRSPWLFLQAAQARFLSGQVPVGMAHLRQGLSLLVERGQFEMLASAGMRFVVELKGTGQLVEAKEIEDYLQSVLPAGFAAGSTSVIAKPKLVLPTTCPGCGGPLRSDEVVRVDDVNAECPYCGSPVRAHHS